jgi:chemotaxis protein MotB
MLILPVGLALWSESQVSNFIAPLKVVEKTAASIPQAHAETAPPGAREKFLDKVQASALGKRIELTADQDNVNLEISDNILFDPGSATLKSHGRQLLNELSALLVAQDYSVSVEGHSDDVPFKSARFASNWELSATRATNVTRYLIDRNISAARLRAVGYADTHPRADNASVEGRARNRRVSLVLHMPVTAAAGSARVEEAERVDRKNTDQDAIHSAVNLSLTD